MKSGPSITEYPIRNLAGLNLLDAAEKVRDNEFSQLQNWWQPSKGVYAKRFGSVIDQASFPLASRISGVWRHHLPNGERFSVYHCVPDATLLPDNTADLTLTELVDGFGAIWGTKTGTKLGVCYSWIGRGMEQTYNTRNRAGFSTLVFPLDASANTSHQTITFAHSDSRLQVTVPAFPAGITGANIFVARMDGNATTQMTYMGTVTVSGGTLIVSEFIGPSGASSDPLQYNLDPLGVSGGGNLKPGSYWIASAWVTDPNNQEGAGTGGVLPLQGSGLQLNNMPATTGTESATPGSLNISLPVFRISVVDDLLVETFLSGIGTSSISNNNVSLDVVIPALPDGAPGTNTFNLYYGTRPNVGTDPATITLHLAASGITPSQTYNYKGPAPTTGQLIPGPAVMGVPVQINLSGSQNAISVIAPNVRSTNGARAIYVFIGTQDPKTHPMTCVGVIRSAYADGTPFDKNTFITITSIPSHNAQSCPYLRGSDQSPPFGPFFNHRVNVYLVGGVNFSVVSSVQKPGQRVQARFGFLMASKNGGPLYEIFPSRSLVSAVYLFLTNSVYAGDTFVNQQNVSIDLHNYAPQPKTQNDLYKNRADSSWVQPFAWQNTPNDPNFCYQLGLSYFANGSDIPWQLDGYTLGQLPAVKAVHQTLLPPIPRYLFVYQNGLVAAGAPADNQVYGSNANAPSNWATGGDGSLLRFVTIGDAKGSGVSAMGIFTPATEATSDPGSFLIAFKKVGTWMIKQISDPAVNSFAGNVGGQTGTPMIQVSGRIGCVAYRSIVQTHLGTIFMGQDANIYMINRIAEPARIGTKIQNGLTHLVGNDSAMKFCTAVFHDNHYKLSFPSAAALLNTPIVNDSEFWADLRTEGGNPIIWNGPHAGRNIGPQVVLTGDDDDLSRLVADGVVVRTYTADPTTSVADLAADGSAQSIVSQMVSKTYRFGAEAHLKRFVGALFDAYYDSTFAHEILFEGFADADYQQVRKTLSTGGALWDSSYWDQGKYGDTLWLAISCLFGETNLVGRTFKFRLTHSNQAQFSLAAAVLYMKPERRTIV